MAKNKGTITALYMRLSQEDERAGESYSIDTQRIILRQAAKDYNLSNIVEYIDDGLTGVLFDNRESLIRLLTDVEAGNISTVLVKDASRFGRNNAMVSYYVQEIFPKRDVRFISLGDHYDSQNKTQSDEMMFGFKSLINEAYAADISQKVRAAFRARAKNGEHTGRPPYGYVWASQDRKKLMVDVETADTVRQMFAWTIEGMGQKQIAYKLRDMTVPSPTALSERRGDGFWPSNKRSTVINWNQMTIRSMLANPVYAGHIVRCRYTTPSYKDKRRVVLPEDEWIVTEDVHEALVSKETFDLAQKALRIKRRPDRNGERNMFQGLLICSDCGMHLSITLRKGCVPYFVCNTYRSSMNKGANRDCTTHSIRYQDVYNTVFDKIKKTARLFQNSDASAFEEAFLNQHKTEKVAESEKALVKLNNHAIDLSHIINNVVRQNSLGVIDDDTFADLMAGYQIEQKDVKTQISKLEHALNEAANDSAGLKKLADTIKKYTDLTELTREILMELIEKVVVHQATALYKSNNREQQVEVYFRFAGILDGVTDR